LPLSALKKNESDTDMNENNPSLMEELRSHAWPTHKTIEQTPFVRGMIDRTLPATSCLDHLRSMAIIHFSLDRALRSSRDKSVSEMLEVYYPRAEHLLKDMAVWDANEIIPDNPESARCALAVADNILLRSMQNPLSLLGYLYVIEGTTLGNQTHIEDVEACCQGGSVALNYYRGHGEATGENWKKFRDKMNGLGLDGSERAAVIAGAVEALECLEEVIQAIYPPPEKRAYISTTFNPEAGDHPVPQDIRAIRAARKAASECLTAWPYYGIRFGERGARFALSDAVWVAAICHLDFDLMSKEVVWLRDFLARKGMPSVTMQTLLEMLGRALVEESVEFEQNAEKLMKLASACGAGLKRIIEPNALKNALNIFEAETGDRNGLGAIAASAYLDEVGGVEGAWAPVESWIKESGRYSPNWIAALEVLINSIRESMNIMSAKQRN